MSLEGEVSINLHLGDSRKQPLLAKPIASVRHRYIVPQRFHIWKWCCFTRASSVGDNAAEKSRIGPGRLEFLIVHLPAQFSQPRLLRNHSTPVHGSETA